MSDLTCQFVEDPKGVILKLAGEFSNAGMDEFSRQTKRLSAQKPPLVVLDLSELNIITSAGIGALLRLQKTMSSLKCTIRLAALTPEIAQVLTLSRLTDVLNVTPTVAEALN